MSNSGKLAARRKGFCAGFKKHRVSIFFALPFLTLFFVFTVIPVLIAIVISFTSYNIIESPVFMGVDNYLTLFLQDDIFMTAVKNTLLFAFTTAPISFCGCLFVAWMINDFPPKIRAVLTFVFYAPSLSGAVSAIWTIIFSNDSYGFANSILTSLGLLREPIQWLADPAYAFVVIVIVTLWTSLGTSFLSLVAGFRGIDTTLYEAAAMDGIKNRVQELWYITLPALKPQLMFSALITITSSFEIGNICNTLFGFPSPNYSAHTIVVHMMDYSTNRFELGMSCAMATVLFLLMVGTNKLVNLFIARVGK